MSVHGIQLHNCQFQPRYDAAWISLEPLLLGRHCQQVAFNGCATLVLPLLLSARARYDARNENVEIQTDPLLTLLLARPSSNSPWISVRRAASTIGVVSKLGSPASVAHQFIYFRPTPTKINGNGIRSIDGWKNQESNTPSSNLNATYRYCV